MADTEFEQFRQCFEKLPQHIRAPAPFYSLVPDVLDDDESPTSSKSDEECGEYDSVAATSGAPSLSSTHTIGTDVDEFVVQRIQQQGGGSGGGGGDEIRVNSPLMMQHQQQLVGGLPARSYGGPPPPPWMPPGERRRRKLPEIPKSKRAAPNFTSTCNSLESAGPPSLASELASVSLSSPAALIPLSSRTVLRRDTGDSSPDSERPYTDVDSGHSTAHSPIEGAKSLSPPFRPHFEMLEATHRGLHKFVPRHRDEIEVEIGDPIYVQKEADDLWCEGVNLRTGRAGIFPSAYAVDTDYSEFDPSCEQVRRERYLLGYLGSVETLAHKGTAVVCQATRRVAGCQLHACVLEVSDRGLRMVDRTKPAPDQPCIDYFYSLKNVSFCAFHPRDHRYLGFITKHPTLQRFACHIFMGAESTRPVAEAVGRAFQRFYQKFIETAYPIEDIYIE